MRRLARGEQLVERVDLHELHAGAGEDFRAGDPGEGVRHDPLRAGVAVVVRLADDFVLWGEQHVIDPPRIDADGDDPVSKLPGGLREAVLDVTPQAEHVPAAGAGDVDGTVGEAVQFLEPDRAAVEQAGNHAAAFGAEIDRKVDTLCHGKASLVRTESLA